MDIDNYERWTKQVQSCLGYLKMVTKMPYVKKYQREKRNLSVCMRLKKKKHCGMDGWHSVKSTIDVHYRNGIFNSLGFCREHDLNDWFS